MSGCEEEIRKLREEMREAYANDRAWHSHAESILATIANALQHRQAAFAVHVPRPVWAVIAIHTCALILIAMGLTIIAVHR